MTNGQRIFQTGASNPRAILNEIQTRIVELDKQAESKGYFMADTPTVTNDSELILMMYQLAFLFGMEPLGYPIERYLQTEEPPELLDDSVPDYQKKSFDW